MRKLLMASLLALLLFATMASAWSDSGYYTSYNGGWSYTPHARTYYSSYSYPSYSHYSGARYYNPTHTWKSGSVYERRWRGYGQTFFMSAW